MNDITWLGLILLQIWVRLKKWINQEEMPLEKYENFLELSGQQFEIQSNPISLQPWTKYLAKSKEI